MHMTHGRIPLSDIFSCDPSSQTFCSLQAFHCCFFKCIIPCHMTRASCLLSHDTHSFHSECHISSDLFLVTWNCYMSRACSVHMSHLFFLHTITLSHLSYSANTFQIWFSCHIIPTNSKHIETSVPVSWHKQIMPCFPVTWLVKTPIKNEHPFTWHIPLLPTLHFCHNDISLTHASSSHMTRSHD